MKPITRAQRVALKRLWLRWKESARTAIDAPPPYRRFRETAVRCSGDDCIIVPVYRRPLWHGIETDGYTHT